MKYGDWSDDEFLTWIEETDKKLLNTKCSLVRLAGEFNCLFSEKSNCFRISRYGIGRRLIMLANAIEEICKIVPLNSIMRTKMLNCPDQARVELLFQALIINLTGTLDNIMLLLNSYYDMGCNTKRIQFFLQSKSEIYTKFKAKNEHLHKYYLSVCYEEKEKLEEMRNTLCHRFSPYYSGIVFDTEGYNRFIEKWKMGISDGDLSISLDDNPYEINSGIIKFEDSFSGGCFEVRIHDSIIHYCSVVIKIAQKTLSELGFEVSI